MARGTLRIYLGAAPGVGKTYAMLNEGRRSLERGRDVVVGYVETHDRPHTREQLDGLEVTPRQAITYRDRVFEEMDVDAVIARRPATALVDELAHTNVPGSRNSKRWQDIEELLAAGISVISTVNIQHLESLNDVVRQITGVLQQETVPDQVVRAADQLELVDMSPESLRRRMAHGNIYKAERVDTALANYFRVGNLAALRELALLWLADRVDEGLQDYRERHGIAEPWETKERVVVALTGSAQGERLIRRGARMAARSRAELVGVHVRPDDTLERAPTDTLDRHRELLRELGGTYAEVTGGDVAGALVAFARSENATQMLLGATNRSRWNELVRGSVINQVIRKAGGIDVHVLSGRDDEVMAAPLPRPPSPHRLARLPVRRRVAGWVLALVGLPALTVLFTQLRSSLGVAGALPEVLFGVVVVAIIGGLRPALVGSVISFTLADWYLIPPLHSFTIGRTGDALALVTFVVVAVLVSVVIDRLTRRGIQVARAEAELDLLVRLTGRAQVTPAEALPALAEQLRIAVGAEAVAVVTFPEDEGPSGPLAPRIEAAAGVPIPVSADDADYDAELTNGSRLFVTGSGLTADDLRLIGVFVAQIRQVLEQRRLEDRAAAVARLEDTNQLQAGLLATISRDVGPPLAAIKAVVARLRRGDLSPASAGSLYTAIDAETDQLRGVVGNLLAMSRLQGGSLQLHTGPVALQEVVAAAIGSRPDATSRVVVDLPADLPTVSADTAFLERAVANLLANALTWSPPDLEVVVTGCETRPELSSRVAADRALVGPGVLPAAGLPAGREVQLMIADRGPGIPPSERAKMFQPLERGEAGEGGGAGLGLTVARGLVDLMGGDLTLDDTPGGGLTATISLPVAEPAGDRRPAGTAS